MKLGRRESGTARLGSQAGGLKKVRGRGLKLVNFLKIESIHPYRVEMPDDSKQFQLRIIIRLLSDK